MSNSNNPKKSSSSSANSVSTSKNDGYHCKPCGSLVGEEQASIECESCLEWFHLDCVGLNKSDMKTIKKPGIHWYCHGCDNNRFRINTRLESIEKQVACLSQTQLAKPAYLEIVQRMNDSIKRNEEQANRQSRALQEQVSKQVKSIQTEIQAESRAKNVILFGVEEKEGTISGFQAF